MWQCPLCQHALDTRSSSWRCVNNHSFDQAKSGYVNLLPVQNKRSKQPGDDKHMLIARRNFHQARGYEPLMQNLHKLIKSHLNGDKTAYTIYEAGCGEGAYLAFVTQALCQDGYDIKAFGSDIAKAGVEMAAKKYKNAQFVVGSNFDLPVAAHTLDVVMQIFAPGNHCEYARVLAKQGMLVTVDPGPNHLCELKALVYTKPELHNAPQLLPDPWRLDEEQRVHFNVDLSADTLKQGLLNMTPYTWKLTKEKYEDIMQHLDTVTADFIIRVWRPQ